MCNNSPDAGGAGLQRARQDHVRLRPQGPFQTELWGSALQVFPAWETHAGVSGFFFFFFSKNCFNLVLRFLTTFIHLLTFCFWPPDRNTSPICTLTSSTSGWRRTCTPPSGSSPSSQPSSRSTWSFTSSTCCCARCVASSPALGECGKICNLSLAMSFHINTEKKANYGNIIDLHLVPACYHHLKGLKKNKLSLDFPQELFYNTKEFK